MKALKIITSIIQMLLLLVIIWFGRIFLALGMIINGLADSNTIVLYVIAAILGLSGVLLFISSIMLFINKQKINFVASIIDIIVFVSLAIMIIIATISSEDNSALLLILAIFSIMLLMNILLAVKLKKRLKMNEENKKTGETKNEGF